MDSCTRGTTQATQRDNGRDVMKGTSPFFYQLSLREGGWGGFVAGEKDNPCLDNTDRLPLVTSTFVLQFLLLESELTSNTFGGQTL